MVVGTYEGYDMRGGRMRSVLCCRYDAPRNDVGVKASKVS